LSRRARLANAQVTLKRREIAFPSRRRLRFFTRAGDLYGDILRRLPSHRRDEYRDAGIVPTDWLRAERAVQAQQRRKAERALLDAGRAVQEELRAVQGDLLIWRVATGEQRSRLSRTEQLGLECLKWESLNSGRQADPNRWPLI
jgi:hypothetical protein